MIPVNDPPDFVKPMLNTPCEAEIVAEKWLQKVLSQLQASRESRQIAKETTYVENIPSLLDRLLDFLHRCNQT
jgi:hypothetical protein